MNAATVTEDPPLTEWIQRAARGEPGAFDRVFSRLYPELRRIAHGRLFAAGSNGQSMSTTELVHESFLRFVHTPGLVLADRRHFFTYAATVMRHVVVDLAREHWTQRRGGGVVHLPLDELTPDEQPLAGGDAANDELLLRIHGALDELEQLDPPLARIVEMQYFAGYSQLEIAGLTGASERTVRRQWDKARAFLLDRLQA
jgi:RNA polymerase sigma factor (TIGR02999 family)